LIVETEVEPLGASHDWISFFSKTSHLVMNLGTHREM